MMNKRKVMVLALILVCLQIVMYSDIVQSSTQILYGGDYFLTHDTTTKYNTLQGGSGWYITQTYREGVISSDGVIKDLYIELSVAPSVGDHYDFTLMVNGAPSALTVHIHDLDTSGNDTTHEIDVVPGDTVTIKCDPNSTPDVSYVTWTSIFEGDVAGESLIMGWTTGGMSATATRYSQVMCAYSDIGVVENNHRQVIPTNGTLTDFYVKLSADPGDAPDGYNLTVRLNGATDADSLIVAIVADDRTGNDTTHNLSVSAGDIVTMMYVPVNTPASNVFPHWGMTFVSDINGESVVMGGSMDALNTGATEYNYITHTERVLSAPWTAAEGERHMMGLECDIKKLYIKLSVAPGVGNKYDFSLNIVGDSDDVVATVSGLDTTGNSGALTDIPTNTSDLTIKVIPDSVPTSAHAYWGFVSYIAGMQIYDRAVTLDISSAYDVSRKVGFSRTATQGLSGAYDVARVVGFSREVTQAISGAYDVTRVVGFLRDVSQGLSGVYEVARKLGLTRDVTQALTTAYSVVADTGFFRGVTLGLNAVFGVERQVSYTRGVTQSITTDFEGWAWIPVEPGQGLNLSGEWIWYNASSVLTLSGTVDSGDINSTWVKGDSDYYNVSEVGGVPGMHVQFNFTGVDDSATSFWFAMWQYYDGNSVHDWDVRIWNFTSGAFQDIDLKIEDAVEFSWLNTSHYALRIPDPEFIEDGLVRLCLYHSSPGNVNHDLSIDYLNLIAFVPFDLRGAGGFGAGFMILLIPVGLIGIALLVKFGNRGRF